MSFMSKLTNQFEGLKANYSDKPKQEESSERGFGTSPANYGWSLFFLAQLPPA